MFSSRRPVRQTFVTSQVLVKTTKITIREVTKEELEQLKEEGFTEVNGKYIQETYSLQRTKSVSRHAQSLSFRTKEITELKIKEDKKTEEKGEKKEVKKSKIEEFKESKDESKRFEESKKPTSRDTEGFAQRGNSWKWQPVSFLLNESEPLGEGSYGIVYKADLVLDNKHKVDPRTSIAVKKSKISRKSTSREATILPRYDPYAVKVKPGSTPPRYILSELKPGIPLDEFLISDNYKRLSLIDKIEYIWQLALQLNHLHHQTRFTFACIHKDIKVENIIIDEKLKRLSLIDFGFCEEFEKEDAEENQLHNTHLTGNPNTMAPEIFNLKAAGTKTDIFSFSSVVAYLLTGKTPYLDRFKMYRKTNDFKRVASTPFNLSSLEELHFPDTYKDIKCVLIAFVKRMASLSYNDRPNSDVTLMFFTTLRLYTRCNPNDTTTRTMHLAKLKLLTAGLWDQVMASVYFNGDFYEPIEDIKQTPIEEKKSGLSESLKSSRTESDREEKSLPVSKIQERKPSSSVSAGHLLEKNSLAVEEKKLHETPINYKHINFSKNVAACDVSFLSIALKLNFVLTMSVFRNALKAYQQNKQSSFFRWTSNESIKTIETMSRILYVGDKVLTTPMTDEQRFQTAQAYIMKYPKKTLSKCLLKAMQEAVAEPVPRVSFQP